MRCAGRRPISGGRSWQGSSRSKSSSPSRRTGCRSRATASTPAGRGPAPPPAATSRRTRAGASDRGHSRMSAGSTRTTTVLGRDIALPILFAPTALHRFAHPDAELATARAAEALGTTMVVSSGASVRFEDVGPTLTKPWFQLYWFTDRELTRVARRACGGQRLRRHRRDRRHAGPLVARGRGPVAAAAVARDLVGQPPARPRSAARGRRQPDLVVAGMAPVDHVAADPAQGDHDRRGRATGGRARPRWDRRVEPWRAPARLVAGDARRAARGRRGGRRAAGDPDGRRHPPRARTC